MTAVATQLAHETNPPASIWALLHDPGVRRSALALVAPNAVIAAIEPAFPLWCGQQFGTPPQTIGAVFLAISLSYLLGAGVAGGVGLRMGRKPTALAGLLLAAMGVRVFCSRAVCKRRWWL
jgi:MFS family permease